MSRKHPTWFAIALALGAPLVFAAPQVLAAMTPEQRAAFRSANLGGSAVNETESLLVFAGVAATLAMLWFAWVTLSAYRAWCGGGLRGVDAGSQVLRALLIMIITLVIVAW